MKIRYLVFLIVTLVASARVGAQGATLEPPPQGAPELPGKDNVPDVPGLPRVELIGDSISGGYLKPVRNLLKGRANVVHGAENGGPTERGLQYLDQWLAIGNGRWDVILFNFGLHDLKYLDAKGHYVSPDKGTQVSSLEVYEANLRQIVARLKKTGAKLIFATTTPVPAGSRGRVKDAELAYNEVAVKVMQENGVEIEDLHALVLPSLAQIQSKANVHFNKQGYELMARDIAARIEKDLPPATSGAAGPTASP